MHYQEHLPSEALAPYIRCYWTLEHSNAQMPHSRERVFPDGCIELLFHYGDRFRKFRPDSSFELQPRSFIHGQLKKFIELEATGRIGIFSVRFQPGGLQGFVNFKVSEITDRIISVEDAWGKPGIELGQEMIQAAGDQERIALIETFLLSRLSISSEDHKMISYCVDIIIREHGDLSVETLSSELGISPRQIERKFYAGVGISPKFLARIIRFNHTLQLIENKTFNHLTTVAFEGGFYDQAHFIRDFRELTGLNPKQYFSENLELVKFFNLE